MWLDKVKSSDDPMRLLELLTELLHYINSYYIASWWKPWPEVATFWPTMPPIPADQVDPKNMENMKAEQGPRVSCGLSLDPVISDASNSTFTSSSLALLRISQLDLALDYTGDRTVLPLGAQTTQQPLGPPKKKKGGKRKNEEDGGDAANGGGGATATEKPAKKRKAAKDTSIAL
jgi:hypothetical protein